MDSAARGVPKASRVAGTDLAALGAVALVEALRTRDDWPGARRMPAAVAVAPVALGIAHLVPARHPARDPQVRASP